MGPGARAVGRGGREGIAPRRLWMPSPHVIGLRGFFCYRALENFTYLTITVLELIIISFFLFVASLMTQVVTI